MIYFGKFIKIFFFNFLYIRWISLFFILLYEILIMKINVGAFGNVLFYKILRNIDKLYIIYVLCMK